MSRPTPAQAANLQDQQYLAKRSEQEKRKMKINRDETPAQAANLQDQQDLAEQENKNDRDILAFLDRFPLPHRYINSTKNVEKG